MNSYRCLVAATALLGCCSGAWAYEEATHAIITQKAVVRSVIVTDPTFMSNLGLGSPSVAAFPSFNGRVPTPFGSTSAIMAVVYGSEWEDQIPLGGANLMAFKHFFDPQWNSGLGRPLTIDGVPCAGLPGAVCAMSPDWMLEHRGIAYSDQYYSFPKGQEQFRLALTSPSPADRQKAFGRVFQTLGHLVHHIQDMAQPQHVRNEPHVHKDDLTPPGEVLKALPQYERYSFRYLTGAGVDSILASNPAYPVPNFDRASDYWYSPTAGNYVGMAEFVAKNYITLLSGYSYTRLNETWTLGSSSEFPKPDARNFDQTPKRVEPRTITRINQTGATRQFEANFVIGSVYDQYFRGTIPYQHLGMQSALGLMRRADAATGTRGYFYDSEEVWRDGYNILIPRAVAFSAGIINHFFRGKVTLARSSGTTWTLSNPSSYVMSGTYYVYGEDASGVRSPLPGAAYSLTLGAGQSTTVTVAEPPSTTKKLAVVFSGQVGAENGRVAGSVTDYVAPVPPSIPCGQPISAGGGTEGLTTTLDLGTTSGTVSVEFEAYDVPDALEIRSKNSARTILVTTVGLVSGFRQYSFHYDPNQSGSRFIDVKVTGNEISSTAWTVAVSCPGQSATPLKPQINVVFGAQRDPLKQRCGWWTFTVNRQTTVGEGQSVKLTPGDHISVTATLDTSSIGYRCLNSSWDAGTPFYSDRTGKHFFSPPAWISVN